MKLIDLTCSKCNATLQVNPALQKCICQYCGNEMLIDNEIQKHQVEFSNGFEFGYQQEKGRQQALSEYKNQQYEQQLQRENDRNRYIENTNRNRIIENIILVASVVCLLPIFSVFFIPQVILLIGNILLFKNRNTYEFSYKNFIFTSFFILLDFLSGIGMNYLLKL